MGNIVQIPNSRCYGANKFNVMYALTGEQVSSLVDYLTSSTFIDNIALLFNTPVENVISLRAYPFDIPTYHASETTEDSNIQISTVETDTQGRKLGFSPLYPISVGSIMIYNRFNNFLDYAPYTKLELYLPFVGFVTLDNTLVMGKALFIDYVVDLFSGKCTAFLSVSDSLDDKTNANIIMTCDGTIANEVQIGGGQGAEIARNMLKLGVGATAGTVATVAGAVATGGASTAVSAAGALGAVSGGVSLLANTAINAITAGQIHIAKGQATQPTINTYAPQKPYLIITQPRVVEPSTYARDYGKPCGKTFTLGALTGFTVVDSIHVEGLATATSDEVTEVERLLKQGVIM